MILSDTPFKEVTFTSKDLVEDEEIDTVYTKSYGARMLLESKGGALAHDMEMYYGPTDYQLFKNTTRILTKPCHWVGVYSG